MMSSYIKFADTLSTSMGKAFSWCIVILMGGTVYEVVMAYAFNNYKRGGLKTPFFFTKIYYTYKLLWNLTLDLQTH